MKKYKFIILTTVFFTLTAIPVLAADSPSAEELAKMNAEVAQIKALLTDARMAIPLNIMADQLKASTDPEAVKAGEKIEKMADDMALSGGGGGGGMSSPGPHGGTTTMPTTAIPSGMTMSTGAMPAGSFSTSGSGTAMSSGAITITPATATAVVVKPMATKATKITAKFPGKIIFRP